MGQAQAIALTQGRPTALGPYIETAVDPEEAVELARLAAKAKRVLEVGTAYGYSTIVMALAGADVTAVDPYVDEPGGRLIALDHFASYGVSERVELLTGHSQVSLALLIEAKESYGLVFIDGDHSRDAVERDLRLGWELVRPGGWLAAHDCHPDMQGVTLALDAEFPDGPDRLVKTLWMKRKATR